MADRLNYLWRLLATGFCFFMFGLGGVVLAVFLWPTVNLLSRDPVRRVRLGRRGVQKSFQWFLWLMHRLGVADFHFHGFENLQNRGGLLIIANHPTLIDVICLVASIDNADCVVKESLVRNPATLGPIRSAGYLVNEGGEKLIDSCVRSIRSGGNLIIFPEGTRSVPGQPFRMQRGAANIALEGGIDVCPVTIRCTPSTLTKREKWYEIPPSKFTMELTVLDDIRLNQVLQPDLSRAVAARNLTTHFMKVLSGDTIQND